MDVRHFFGRPLLIGIIYLATLNGVPKYVGQVLQTERRRHDQKFNTPEKLLQERKRTHRWGNCRAFKAALKKYGTDAFDFETLHAFRLPTETELRKKANAYEIAAIAHYGTLAPNGYNLTTGGQSEFKMSDETCNRLSEAGKARKGKYTDTARMNMSAALMGHPVTPATRELISQRCKDAMNDDRRQAISDRNSKLTAAQEDELVADYSNGKSASDLATEYGVCVTTITNHLRDRDVEVVQGKGGHYACGENHPQAKLSVETVRAIYARKSSRVGAGAATAREFGVRTGVVSNIWTGKKWSTVTGASTRSK